MKQLVLASGNPGKLRELSAILDDLGYRLTAQSEFDVEEVAETGTTFVENAIIKARHAASQTGLAALADDSGIEVDALNGAPGVYSARFSGPGGSDALTRTNYITVNEPAPTASFTGSPTSGTSPLNVNFTDASTGSISSIRVNASSLCQCEMAR